MQDKHIKEALLEYASFLVVKKIDLVPGLWIKEVDENWTIKMLTVILKKWKVFRLLVGILSFMDVLPGLLI